MHATKVLSRITLPARDSKVNKILTTLATICSAVEEGVNKAEQYEASTGRKSY